MCGVILVCLHEETSRDFSPHGVPSPVVRRYLPSPLDFDRRGRRESDQSRVQPTSNFGISTIYVMSELSRRFHHTILVGDKRGLWHFPSKLQSGAHIIYTEIHTIPHPSRKISPVCSVPFMRLASVTPTNARSR